MWNNHLPRIEEMVKLGLDTMLKEGILHAGSHNKATEFGNAVVYRINVLEEATSALQEQIDKTLEYTKDLDMRVVNLMNPGASSMTPWKEEEELISAFKRLVNKEPDPPKFFDYSSLRRLINLKQSIQDIQGLVANKKLVSRDLWAVSTRQETIYLYSSRPNEDILQRLFKRYDVYLKKKAKLEKKPQVQLDAP